MATSFDFVVWAKDCGLNDKTIDKLKSQDLDDREALELIDIQLDIPMLKLTAGQAAKFRNAVGKIQGKAKAQSVPDSDQPVTLDEIRQLADQQEAWNQAANGTSLQSILHPGQGPTATLPSGNMEHVNTFDPTFYLKPRVQCKYLDITDFVTVNGEEQEEEVISSKDGIEMVLRTSGKQSKIPLNKVTVGQWSAANLCILYNLMSEGTLTHERVPDYLAYSIKILEFLPLYEWQSILAYDREYRKKQATYKFRWGVDPPHMNKAMLIPKFLTRRDKFKQGDKPKNSNGRFHSRPRTQDGGEICLLFNSKQGCKWGTSCKYVHVCLEPRCGKDHPQFEHKA